MKRRILSEGLAAFAFIVALLATVYIGIWLNWLAKIAGGE